jgi:hypothetical protein
VRRIRLPWFGPLVAAALVGGSVLLFPGAMAAANVITPPAACTATGHWLSAGFTKSSTQYVPSDIVKIPQKDKVDWIGHEDGKPIGYFGPPRPIDGAVQVTVPFGISVTVWHWGGHKSPRYSNEGQESYNVPSILIGIPMKLSGYEKDNGVTVCSGSVYVEVTGSRIKNPLGWAGLAGIVIFGAGLLAAGFKKTRPAYDDLNP